MPSLPHHSLLPTAAGLLTQLTNTLNITTLASQILRVPALWHQHIELAQCRTVFSLFYTSSLRITESSRAEARTSSGHAPAPVSPEEWAKAVIQGADQDSPRWRHTLLIGGLLLGFGQQEQHILPATLRHRVESALVEAANLSMQDATSGETGRASIVFVLNNAFPLLSDFNRSQIQYQQLLPIMIATTFFSREGLQTAYFVGAMDRDVVPVQSKRFGWSASSATYHAVSDLQTKPLTASMGPLARLMSYAIDQVPDSGVVLGSLEELYRFSKALSVQWRQNKLSEIDRSEENIYLDSNTSSNTMPKLWLVLRTVLFTHIIVLRAILARTLSDCFLGNDFSKSTSLLMTFPVLIAVDAPMIATNSLLILRNLYFISSRLGETSSSQHVFVNLAALDILGQYPEHTVHFLEEIQPHEFGSIPSHPLERNLDLFYLNTVENLTNVLSPSLNERFAFDAASPYLISGGNSQLMEIFEAAHSVALSMFATPQCAELAAKHLPLYIETLFNAFPNNLSIRQFRLALKTAVKVTTPPSPLALTQPLLPAILLDLVHERALRASGELLSEPSKSLAPNLSGPEPPLSEQAALVLSIIDTLCLLPIELLKEWLPLTANLIHQVSDENMKIACQERLWEALSSGEMDVERAAVGVAWWTTQGGKSQVLAGYRSMPQKRQMMSGGLTESNV